MRAQKRIGDRMNLLLQDDINISPSIYKMNQHIIWIHFSWMKSQLKMNKAIFRNILEEYVKSSPLNKRLTKAGVETCTNHLKKIFVQKKIESYGYEWRSFL